jgi:hypothetical protein
MVAMFCDEQAMPQPPQFETLVVVSTQEPLHIVEPEAHLHWPPWQT